MQVLEPRRGQLLCLLSFVWKQHALPFRINPSSRMATDVFLNNGGFDMTVLVLLALRVVGRGCFSAALRYNHLSFLIVIPLSLFSSFDWAYNQLTFTDHMVCAKDTVGTSPSRLLSLLVL